MVRINVLIVGAGPTGLMMASELLRHGITCRLIDKVVSPSSHSKAIAIQARTLELLHQSGLADLFLNEGLKLHAGTIFSNKKRVAHIEFKHIPSPFPYVLSLEQSQTEALFAKHLRSKGLRIERGVELTSFKQQDAYVEATLRHASGLEERILTDWVIGCDGAHSILRKGIGAKFKGQTFSDVFSLADVEILWDLAHDQVAAFIESKGVMAALPLPGDNRYRLIFQLKRCRDLLKGGSPQEGIIDPSMTPPPTFEEVKETLFRCLGKEVEVRNPEWLANFHINSRLASMYRDDRIFLAGDAAHIHSPVGGQGMNTGLQDAFNLAWKLALVQKGKAHPSLLDSYQTERYEVGEKLLKMTEWASFTVTLHNPLLVSIRNFILRHVTHFHFAQRKITGELSELSIHYPNSPLNHEHGPFMGTLKPGDRAPNGIVLLQDRITSLFDLWKEIPECILLFFTGDRTDTIDAMEQLAEELEARYPIKAFIIASNPPIKTSTRLLLDPDLKVHETYGTDEPSIYLIRPDLYISYRQTGIKKECVEDYLKNFITFVI